MGQEKLFVNYKVWTGLAGPVPDGLTVKVRTAADGKSSWKFKLKLAAFAPSSVFPIPMFIIIQT